MTYSRAIVEPLLRIAEELERRDEDAAAALLEVERLQAEVQEIRAQAGAAASFLARLPEALAARETDLQTAAVARLDAETPLRDAEAALEQAEKENERLAAARAVQQARGGRAAAGDLGSPASGPGSRPGRRLSLHSGPWPAWRHRRSTRRSSGTRRSSSWPAPSSSRRCPTPTCRRWSP